MVNPMNSHHGFMQFRGHGKNVSFILFEKHFITVRSTGAWMLSSTLMEVISGFNVGDKDSLEL